MCGPNSFFCLWIQFSQHHCWIDYSFCIEFSWPLCWKSIDRKCMVYFWTLNSVPLMFIITPVPHCLAYCSFVLSFKIRKCESSNLFFFKIVWLVWVPWLSIWILRSTCQYLQKNGNWAFDRGCVESVDHYGEYCHLSFFLNFYLFRILPC